MEFIEVSLRGFVRIGNETCVEERGAERIAEKQDAI